MVDTITGLPVHPLVVHAVIVLLPLTALGAILVAVKPAWNRRYGWLVLTGAVVSFGSALVAKESGEALASRVGFPADHVDAGGRVPLVALALLVVVAVLWWLDRRSQERATAGKVVAGLSVLVAVGALVAAVIAGHSGATAVWKPIVDNTTPGQVSPPGE
jgi:uncharacterized membrane protein